MQVTFGEEGSGFSKVPRFLLPVGNIGEAWPPLMLPLFLSLLLTEVDSEDGSLLRLGLRIHLEESFMDEDDKREVKQMKSSLVLLLLLVVLWFLSVSIFFPH